jgi:pyruvate,water dikinase
MDSALFSLARLQGTAVFPEALAAFLARYGHRSFHLDIFYPPFADEPTQVDRLLAALGQEVRNPRDSRATTREQAQHSVRAALATGLLGWLKLALFDHVLRLAQYYMPLREEQRFCWQRTLALMRRLFLLLGTRMTAAGVLDDPKRVFFLTKAEVEAHVRGCASGTAYAALTTARELQHRRLCQEFHAAPDWSYPPFLCGNRPLETERQAHEQRFRGQAVSPGLARGRAVVLFTPAELDRVRPGDVLVTRSIDSAWTPVFGLLSALVVEHGGQLSHGSVVAREYGLPAVAGIRGITRLLHNGDMVMVDGLNGLIGRLPGNE